MAFEITTTGLSEGSKATLYLEATQLASGSLLRTLEEAHQKEREEIFEEIFIGPMINTDPHLLKARIMELRGRMASQTEFFDSVRKLLEER